MASHIIALYLAGPVLAQEAHKNPLSYSLREYGLILAIAMLGGFVRWYNAVRRGESVTHDLRISATAPASDTAGTIVGTQS